MTEHDLQSFLTIFMERYFPHVLWFHVPNEGKRSWREGKRQKQAGLRAGVADNVFLIGGSSFFIELKTEKGRQSPAQKTFQATVETMGYEYYICRSQEEIRDTVISWQQRGLL